MTLYKQLFFIVCLILLDNFCDSQAVEKNGSTPNYDWDYILYSQRWPISSCAVWQEAKLNNTCNLPKVKNTWTVHGIWPTKTGTNGPSSCPSAIHFDPNALNPIIDELSTYWVNVEANTKPNSFWKHEWDKHGTCAIILPELDSILNYFEQGLDWNQEYNLTDILTQGKIVPGTDGYTIDQIYNAVKSYTKKNPTIECVVDEKTKESMISEIRICFNKSLEVIDCDQSNLISTNGLKAITNCSLKKPIMYFAEVPNFELIKYTKALMEQMYYMDIYRILKFLIWFTT